MSDSRWLLVDKKILPEIYAGVEKAKELLQSGEAQNASQAAKMAGISRSAYYKYKDHIFKFDEDKGGRIVNIHALLQDTAGVLSAFISVLYNNGANIVTLNQNVPVNGLAPVSVSIRTDNLNCSLENLLDSIKQINGVKSIIEFSE